MEAALSAARPRGFVSPTGIGFSFPPPPYFSRCHLLLSAAYQSVAFQTDDVNANGDQQPGRGIRVVTGARADDSSGPRCVTTSVTTESAPGCAGVLTRRSPGALQPHRPPSSSPSRPQPPHATPSDRASRRIVPRPARRVPRPLPTTPLLRRPRHPPPASHGRQRPASVSGRAGRPPEGPVPRVRPPAQRLVPAGKPHTSPWRQPSLPLFSSAAPAGFRL